MFNLVSCASLHGRSNNNTLQKQYFAVAQKQQTSLSHIVHIINLSIFPPESRVKVQKALLSAWEENHEPLALLSRFRKDVYRVFLC